MKTPFKLIGFIGLIASQLLGCSSSDEHERNLELLADNRANLLSASLPLEYGPLNILQATAKGSTVRLSMVYNEDNAKLSAAQLYQNSVHGLCRDKAIEDNLSIGLRYHIDIRNTRGQVIVSETLTSKSCESP